MSITAGTARNVWKHRSRKDHNVRKEGSNISNSNHSRASREETTAVRTHQQQAHSSTRNNWNSGGCQQQQGTPATAGDANNLRDSKTGGNMLTTVGTPQQELQGG
jgi:hypothetical protein